MKVTVNKNYLWSQIIVKQLAAAGVKYASISPGSRSTPLTLAFDNNKKIKTFLQPDERSSGFFALGLAKQSRTPVAVVTTSGTAVAELYPAIIEAYMQRVPLIICTADRPEYLYNTGANQTINQINIFRNHIRGFYNIDLPDIKIRSLKKLVETLHDTVKNGSHLDRGPVHVNIPFEKPLEPKTKTDEIDKSFYQKITSDNFYIKNKYEKPSTKNIASVVEAIADKLKTTEKGIIICGNGIDDSKFPFLINSIAQKLGYPIFADGTSSLRFGGHSKSNIVTNFTSFTSAEKFAANYDPEIIIQFGKAPTSKQLLTFYRSSKAAKYLISEYGELNDPSKTADVLLKIPPIEFCGLLADNLNTGQISRSGNWLINILNFDLAASVVKKEIIEKAEFPFEGRIVKELLSRLRNNCNIMISNSMPVRDIDYFASTINKKINIYTNRGASGIDGIISTALGIAEASKDPTILLTGDLAFYHDMNGLLAAMKYSIPITIVLINNNGGGIFESLPVADSSDKFVRNFITPHNLDFANFVLGYNGHYINARHWEHFGEQFPKTFSRDRFAVIEIRTDANISAKIRKSYFAKVNKTINAMIKQ